MKMSGNVVLITGGTSGIGFELAAQLLALDNTVIITGRHKDRLDDAQKKLPGVQILLSDVSDPVAIALLAKEVTAKWPALNMLVNNAGIMRKINVTQGGSDLDDLAREVETNLLGPMQMVQAFLSHLKTLPSAIVNVSSGLAFIPLPISPVYSASKAALHSYTQSLRVQLKGTSVKVFEFAPPGTNTPLNDIFLTGGMDSSSLMDVRKLVAAGIRGLQSDRFEIRPGLSNVLKLLSRIAPGFGLNLLSKQAASILATK